MASSQLYQIRSKVGHVLGNLTLLMKHRSDVYEETAVLQTYSTVVELLSSTNCYGSLLEVLMR